MTPPPAHSLRCETCENEDCFHHPTHWKNAITEYRNSAHYAHGFTAEYGCASHTSAGIAEKVLDDFAIWVKTEWVQESIKDYKAELRQQEQREEA